MELSLFLSKAYWYIYTFKEGYLVFMRGKYDVEGNEIDNDKIDEDNME